MLEVYKIAGGDSNVKNEEARQRIRNKHQKVTFLGMAHRLYLTPKGDLVLKQTTRREL